MPDYQKDSELINAAIAGDTDAMYLLIKSVMPGVESAAALHAGSGAITRHDLVQEGIIGAINAVFSFDETRGVKFSTYAEKCISNSISSAVKKNSRQKQQVLNTYIPLEDVENSLVGTSGNPENIVSMEESVDVIQNCISQKLTTLERDVLMLHIAEESYEQIADKLGINIKAVGNALSRARQKIRAEISKDS